MNEFSIPASVKALVGSEVPGTERLRVRPLLTMSATSVVVPSLK